VKYCVIQKVAFKTPDRKSRIVWADVIAESEGLALVLVPKSDRDGSHTIFIAQENVAERCFEAVTPYRFNLESEAVKEAGEKLRMLGKSFYEADFHFRFRRERDDDF
jgi:hypothetical protein